MVVINHNLLVKLVGCIHFILMLTDLAHTTVDLNLSQLGYVADHLQPDECRQLVAALHSKEYDISPNLDLKVRKVPRDETCLKMLLHWNSSPGEGLGQTHEQLYRRLSQLNHKELADWLSKNVFHQLSRELDKSLLQNPFKEAETTPNVSVKCECKDTEPYNLNSLESPTEQWRILRATKAIGEAQTSNEDDGNLQHIIMSKITTQPPKQKESETEGWTPFDTICCTIIILLSCCILILIIQGLWDYTCEVLRKRRDKKTSGVKSKRRNSRHDQNYTSSQTPPVTVVPKYASNEALIATVPPHQKPVNI